MRQMLTTETLVCFGIESTRTVLLKKEMKEKETDLLASSSCESAAITLVKSLPKAP